MANTTPSQFHLNVDFADTTATHQFRLGPYLYVVFRPHQNPYSDPPDPDGVTVFAPHEELYRTAGYRYIRC